MTAQQVRWRVLRHLISLSFTLSLAAVFALAMWRVRPETFAMWLASLLVAVHMPGITLDAWQCIRFLTLRVGDDPLPQRPSRAGAATPSTQRRKPMTARRAILSVSALLVLTVLLIGGWHYPKPGPCRDARFRRRPPRIHPRLHHRGRSRGFSEARTPTGRGEGGFPAWQQVLRPRVASRSRRGVGFRHDLRPPGPRLRRFRVRIHTLREEIPGRRGGLRHPQGGRRLPRPPAARVRRRFRSGFVEVFE